MVYGSDPARAAALRTFSGGKLKTSAGNLLPLNDAATFPEGPLENDNEGRLDPATLFISGDVRTNENVLLASLRGQPGILSVAADFESRTATVAFDPAQTDTAAIAELIRLDTGFSATLQR